MKRVAFLTLSLLLTSNSAFAFDASDQTPPTATIHLASPGTPMPGAIFGGKLITDLSKPVVMEIDTTDDKNWVVIENATATNWILIAAYPVKLGVSAPPACGTPPALKVPLNLFELTSERKSDPNGQKHQKFILVGVIPPAPDLTKINQGCENFLDLTKLSLLMTSPNFYGISGWLSTGGDGVGIVLGVNIKDEAGRTGSLKGDVSADNSSYFFTNINPKSFISKTFNTFYTPTWDPQTISENLATFSKRKKDLSDARSKLLDIKNSGKADQSTLMSISDCESKEAAYQKQFDSEIQFANFYQNPTLSGALSLPLSDRGTILPDITSDDLQKLIDSASEISRHYEISLQPTTAPPLPSKDVANKKSLTPSAKITITCLKGKAALKVTAISPKCPAGYKKK